MSSLEAYGSVCQVWKVEELTTQGWSVQDPKRDVGLNESNAKIRLEFYLGEGVSKERLRAVPDK
tara:strand:- start:306 stop:497 length:192 start_codon:yes stop_codon:yes gene_type:complete